jgi:hypothetical protein
VVVLDDAAADLRWIERVRTKSMITILEPTDVRILIRWLSLTMSDGWERTHLGLAKTRIPQAARIVVAADVFDALISVRPQGGLARASGGNGDR